MNDDPQSNDWLSATRTRFSTSTVTSPHTIVVLAAITRSSILKFIAPKIEMRPISSLRPYAGNARRHSKKQIGQIADSIQRFGFTNPVLISDDDEIIAGHGRVMAAKKLSFDTVPAIKLSHLTAAERRAYILADNKLALNAGCSTDLAALAPH